MKKSQRLGYDDLRTLYLLVGEWRELGADLVVWRAHALQALLRLPLLRYERPLLE
jgi:hypothetical protein